MLFSLFKIFYRSLYSFLFPLSYFLSPLINLVAFSLCRCCSFHSQCSTYHSIQFSSTLLLKVLSPLMLLSLLVSLFQSIISNPTLCGPPSYPLLCKSYWYLCNVFSNVKMFFCTQLSKNTKCMLNTDLNSWYFIN